MQGGSVGEVVEPLTLEVGRGGVDQHRHGHQAEARHADDQHRHLALLVAAPHGTSSSLSSGTLSTYCPIGTVWLEDRAKVAASSPRILGAAGRRTDESTRTVMTAVPTWQLPCGDRHETATRTFWPGAPLVRQHLLGDGLGTRRTGRVVGCERVRPSRGSRCRADREGTALHLEDRHDDPHQWDQQEERQPGELHQGRPAVVAGAPAHCCSALCCSAMA